MLPILLFAVGAGVVAIMLSHKKSEASDYQMPPWPGAKPPPEKKRLALTNMTPYKVLKNGVKLYRAAMKYDAANKEPPFSRPPQRSYPAAVVHVAKFPSGNIRVVPKLVVKPPGGESEEDKIRKILGKYTKTFKRHQGLEAIEAAKKAADALGQITGQFTRGGGDVLIQQFSMPGPLKEKARLAGYYDLAREEDMRGIATSGVGPEIVGASPGPVEIVGASPGPVDIV